MGFRRVAIATITIAFAGSVVVPAPAQASSHQRVLVVGDSIVQSAADMIVWWSALGDNEVDVIAMGGTAPCDFYDSTAEVVAALDPDVVILSFTGNSITPCVSDVAPEDGVYDDEYFERYAQVAATLTEIAGDGGATVYWTDVLSGPRPGQTVAGERLEQIYEDTPGVRDLIPLDVYYSAPDGTHMTAVSGIYEWEPARVNLRADDDFHLGELGQVRLGVLLGAWLYWVHR